MAEEEKDDSREAKRVRVVEFGSGEDFQARRMQRESKGLQTSGYLQQVS
jgi:hypothetical protein